MTTSISLWRSRLPRYRIKMGNCKPYPILLRALAAPTDTVMCLRRSSTMSLRLPSSSSSPYPMLRGLNDDPMGPTCWSTRTTKAARVSIKRICGIAFPFVHKGSARKQHSTMNSMTNDQAVACSPRGWFLMPLALLTWSLSSHIRRGRCVSSVTTWCHRAWSSRDQRWYLMA